MTVVVVVVLFVVTANCATFSIRGGERWIDMLVVGQPPASIQQVPTVCGSTRARIGQTTAI